MASSLLNTILLSKELGVSFLGEYTLVNAYINLVSSASVSGFGFVIIRSLSTSSPSVKHKYFFYILIAIVIPAIVVAFALCIFSYIFFPHNQRLIQFVSVLAIPAALNTAICMASRHFSGFIYFKSNITLPLSALLLCTFTSLFLPAYSIKVSPFGVIISSWVLASLIQGINLINIFNEKAEAISESSNARWTHVKTGVVNAFTNSFRYKFGDLFDANGQNINLFLASSFLGFSELAVGVCTILQKITSIPSVIFQQISVFENVKIAKLFNDAEIKTAFFESRKLSVKGFWVSVLSFPFVLIIYKNADVLFGLSSILSSQPYIMLSALLLLFSFCLPLMAGSVGLLARLLGFEKMQNTIIVASRIVSLFILLLMGLSVKNYIDNQILGVLSLSLSTFVYIVSWNLTLAFCVKQYTKSSVNVSFGLLS